MPRASRPKIRGRASLPGSALSGSTYASCKKNVQVLLILSVVAVWCSPAMGQTILKMGSQFAAKSTSVLAMEKFAEYVKDKTNGKYTVRIFSGGQLGPDREMQQSLKLGTLDLLHATNNAPT